ncbi:MAG: hypothetical protein U0457_18320 [Candidatus Sericytochromatia bacterium]
MPDTQAYIKYREQLPPLLDRYVNESHKNILIFGDKFEHLEAKWQEQGKNVVNLKNIKSDWSENITNFNFEKTTFDLLISYHGIEKAINPEKLLLELRKPLIKSADFICITYNVTHISSLVNLFTEGWEKKDDGALRNNSLKYFSYDSLKHLLKLTGFDLVGEDIYAFQEQTEMTRQLMAFTKNPYLNALSFILRTKKVDGFPFIEGTYP